MNNVLNEELTNYILQLNDSEKKSILLMLKTFLNRKETDRVSLEQYNEEIDEALMEVEAGNFLTQKEVELQVAKW